MMVLTMLKMKMTVMMMLMLMMMVVVMMMMVMVMVVVVVVAVVVVVVVMMMMVVVVVVLTTMTMVIMMMMVMRRRRRAVMIIMARVISIIGIIVVTGTDHRFYHAFDVSVALAWTFRALDPKKTALKRDLESPHGLRGDSDNLSKAPSTTKLSIV